MALNEDIIRFIGVNFESIGSTQLKKLFATGLKNGTIWYWMKMGGLASDVDSWWLYLS